MTCESISTSYGTFTFVLYPFKALLIKYVAKGTFFLQDLKQLLWLCVTYVFSAADIENLANKVQEKLKEATPSEGLFSISFIFKILNEQWAIEWNGMFFFWKLLY